jgi:hypothetical protein
MDMADPSDGVFSWQGSLSPEEITERFKKVFGRDMNPAERRGFFMDLPISPEKESPEL